MITEVTEAGEVAVPDDSDRLGFIIRNELEIRIRDDTVWQITESGKVLTEGGNLRKTIDKAIGKFSDKNWLAAKQAGNS
jgi:hypothetical protein